MMRTSGREDFRVTPLGKRLSTRCLHAVNYALALVVLMPRGFTQTSASRDWSDVCVPGEMIALRNTNLSQHPRAGIKYCLLACIVNFSPYQSTRAVSEIAASVCAEQLLVFSAQ